MSFHSIFCIIHDGKINIVKEVPTLIRNVYTLSKEALWHQSLGHAPIYKTANIDELNGMKNMSEDMCLTCPLARFTKLTYTLSESAACSPFKLVHINAWGHIR